MRAGALGHALTTVVGTVENTTERPVEKPIEKPVEKPIVFVRQRPTSPRSIALAPTVSRHRVCCESRGSFGRSRLRARAVPAGPVNGRCERGTRGTDVGDGGRRIAPR